MIESHQGLNVWERGKFNIEPLFRKIVHIWITQKMKAPPCISECVYNLFKFSLYNISRYMIAIYGEWTGKQTDLGEVYKRKINTGRNIL